MRAWIVPLVVAALGVTGEASAFCRKTTCDEADPSCKVNKAECVSEGTALSWKVLPIPYRFYEGGSAKLDRTKMRQAVRNAVKAWQSVRCDDGATALRFEEGADIEDDKPLGISPAEAEKAGVAPYGIYFRDKKWTHDDGAESIAATFHAFGTQSGIISYADIEVNTANYQFHFDLAQAEGDVDFQAVITHEIGHYFGLAHSKDPESIMAPSYCQEGDRCSDGTKSKRALSEDDIAGVCALYPHSLHLASTTVGEALASNDEARTAGCQQSARKGSFVSTSGVFWAALAVIGCRRWRRARRA